MINLRKFEKTMVVNFGCELKLEIRIFGNVFWKLNKKMANVCMIRFTGVQIEGFN